MQDEIASALNRFAKERTKKRGFLLVPGEAYFLYDRQFCGICDYQLRMRGSHCRVDSSSTDTPMFFGIIGETLRYSVHPEHPHPLEYLRILFHIPCGTEPEELLRGILLTRGAEAHLALFSDPAIEEVFLASEPVNRTPPAIPAQEIMELQKQYAHDDLRLLIEIYLKGKAWRSHEDLESEN